MTTRVSVIGASGRAGKLVIELLPEFSDLALAFGVDRAGSLPDGSFYTSDRDKAISGSDVVIDFSSPESSVETAKLCAKYGKAALIAATGQSESEISAIREAGITAPILIAPNTSLGVFALVNVSKQAKKILGSSFDIEIVESHHRKKKDAPSGTALLLGRSLTEEKNFVFDRSPKKAEREKNEIGIVSIRGGDVVGEHTVHFLGDGEELKITHTVRDRRVFARGALVLSKLLVGCKPGVYGVKDLLER